MSIFMDAADGGARKHDSQARFYALRVLDEFLGNR